MMRIRRRDCGACAVVSVGALLALSACGGGSSSAAGKSSGLDVVASTNVWGSVASAIGGDRVRVTSVISDATADPHSFEADARVELAVSRADVVIENGGGYDDFMQRLISAATSTARVVDAVDASGRAAAARAAHEELNEHVWYDLRAVSRVGDAIASALGAADPGDAAGFRANAQTFRRGLDALVAQETADEARTRGAGVLVTEPVPLYMLDALGAVDRTPPAFSRAVEEGGDVPPAVLQQTEDLLGRGAVKALVYNAQTAAPQTEALEKAAARHRVAVVPVTEVLPAGQTYLAWMKATLAALTRALSS